MRRRASIITTSHRSVLSQEVPVSGERQKTIMKSLFTVLAALAVWTAPSIGQPNPSTSGSSSASSPNPALPVSPPNTRNSVEFPPQTNRPSPPARVGFFTPPGNNRFPAPPTGQQRTSPLLPAWGDLFLADPDLFETPCGIGQIFPMALDIPDHFCQCRMGGCGFDDTPHLSNLAHSQCHPMARCCCSGSDYRNFAAATLMRNSLFGASGHTPNRMSGHAQSGTPAGRLNFPGWWTRR